MSRNDRKRIVRHGTGNGIVKEMDDKRNNAIQVTETTSVHMSANKKSTYTTTFESTENRLGNLLTE